MTTAHASEVKVAGHRNENDFAALIGGQVNLGSHTDKKDVIDQQHRSHSVKAGTKWQIFLYARERLRTNTIFQGLGQVANMMVACLDAFPPTYADYLRDKAAAKRRLQPEMRNLLAELQQPAIFRAFLDKALFDGGNADYLTVFPGPAAAPAQGKAFHMFHKDDVVDMLSNDIHLHNSRARRQGQWDAQKVTFRSNLLQRIVGEIEVRRDGPPNNGSKRRPHYREMKFWLKGPDVLDILTRGTQGRRQPCPQVFAYGRAARFFKVADLPRARPPGSRPRKSQSPSRTR